MPEPSIRTRVVGSYPIPAWLGAFPSAAALRDAILVAIKTQELAGIDLVSDGELSRFDINHPETNGMVDYFVNPMGGISTELSRSELEKFRREKSMEFRLKPAGVVSDRVTAGTLDLPSAWELASPLALRPLMFTVTSPYMLARTLVNAHYPDLQALCHDLATVLADQITTIDTPVLQVDEATLTGHPEDGDWVHGPINTILDAAQGERSVHLCFGNYGGSTIQHGFWVNLLPFLNELHVDHLILEFARRGYDELEVLRDLREEIALGIGVIDIKDNEVESADAVARRIEQAVAVLGADRIKWVHPDCGFWVLSRSVTDRKMAALVSGRDLFLGAGNSAVAVH